MRSWSACSGGATAGVILDGVEDMQILYGENLGATHRYVDINTVGNKAAIDTVRLCVLLRTAENWPCPGSRAALYRLRR